MLTFTLLLLPKAVLLYIAEFFFVYSVIFHRMDIPFASYMSLEAFNAVSEIYAQKTVTHK